jgi:hypothetical protein
MKALENLEMGACGCVPGGWSLTKRVMVTLTPIHRSGIVSPLHDAQLSREQKRGRDSFSGQVVREILA